MKEQEAKKEEPKKVKKIVFPVNEVYMPLTMQQFEDFTNEMLKAINILLDPHFLSSDYMAQIVMSALHAYDNNHKKARIKKSEIFESCINRISSHVTFHAVEAIKEKLKKENQPTPSEDLNSSQSENTTAQ